MSRQRRQRWIKWSDEAGRIYEQPQRRHAPARLGAIPEPDRLVDVFDDSGDLVAVLTRPDLAPYPLLFVRRAQGGPSAALTDDGLVGVLISVETETAGLFGAAVPEWTAECPDCGKSYTISAADLRAKALSRPTRPGHVPRLIVHKHSV